MPYADKEKQKEYWREYQQRPGRKQYKKEWNERNRGYLAEKQRARVAANPDKYREYFRNRHVLKKYGLAPGDYERMLTEQSGVCAVCGSEPDIDRHGILRLAIDHCHATGKVRGLLCNNCNAGIGLIGDTIEHLEACIRYLKGFERKESDSGSR